MNKSKSPAIGMRNKKVALLIRLLPVIMFVMVSILEAQSQDILFTNYQNTPLVSNPAFVAFDNNLKVGLSYRGRISKASQTYDMPIASVSYPLINQEKARRWGGLGFSVLSDMSGNSQMIKTTGAKFAFAYNFNLTEKQRISTSLGAGYLIRQFNLSNMKTGNQYVPDQGYDPSLPLNESFTNDSKGYLDLSAGLLWQLTDIHGNSRAFVGLSGFHLNKPDISLSDFEDYLEYRYGAQLGIRVFHNKRVSFFPDAVVNYQLEVLHYNLGVRVIVPLKAFEKGYLSNSIICFKPRYISGEFASLGIEFRKPDYHISFGYDFSISNKAIKANMINAYEISFVYTKGLMKPKKKEKEKIIVDENYIVGEERVFEKQTEVIVVRDTVYLEDSTKTIEKEWTEDIAIPEKRITFNYKSDKVEEEAQEELKEIIEFMLKNNDYVLEIEGHTDNIGDNESNKRHSLRRAQAIADYLVEQGLLRSRIRVSGRGETKPVATNATEEGRAKNRRVEFTLYKIVK